MCCVLHNVVYIILFYRPSGNFVLSFLRHVLMWALREKFTTRFSSIHAPHS